ncbi:MAG: S1C family serine protease [Candidatus Nanohaloarchaea archaeon]|nr:S1C family serine protease [Candidatus Nanohaloarchaea archaeon]
MGSKNYLWAAGGALLATLFGGLSCDYEDTQEISPQNREVIKEEIEEELEEAKEEEKKKEVVDRTYEFDVPHNEKTYTRIQEEVENSSFKTMVEATYTRVGGRINSRSDMERNQEEVKSEDIEFPKVEEGLEDFYQDAIAKDVYSIDYTRDGSFGDLREMIKLEGHGSMTSIAQDEDETFFLTAHHLKPPKVVRTPFGTYKLEDSNMYYKTYDDHPREIDLTYEFGDKDIDAAVLSAETTEPDINNLFADIEKIEEGNVVVNSGFPLNLEKSWTVGNITSKGLDEVGKKFPSEKDAFYIMDKHTNTGESGSAIYVLDKGEDGELKPRLAGIVNWSYTKAQAVNGTANIGKILEMLEDQWIFMEPDVK